MWWTWDVVVHQPYFQKQISCCHRPAAAAAGRRLRGRDLHNCRKLHLRGDVQLWPRTERGERIEGEGEGEGSGIVPGPGQSEVRSPWRNQFQVGVQ